MKRIQTTGVLLFAVIQHTFAQAPTGSLAGAVRDPSGAAVTAAHVRVLSRATGLARTELTQPTGDYSFPSLWPGDYEVSVEATGFERIVRQATVEAGTATATNFTLIIGDIKQSLTVEGATPEIQYDSHTVGGVVTQGQIEGLPLNGRNFLELGKLEPGVQPPSPSNNNRVFVPILGGPGGNTGSGGRGTRVTVDGGSIMAVGSFGSQMGFSQEVVQEFQISAANFDLSTGATDAGAVNVVTRSGGNAFHGTAFYFFRDHTLSAYPGLARDLANPNPFFQRRQFGLAGGGPVRRDRMFFFADWERNEQRGVVDTTLLDPSFAQFSRITTNPLFGDQFSVRLDGRISARHTMFVRHSHDGYQAFAPSPSTGANYLAAYPSQWTHQTGWTDQSLLGLTSVIHPTLINDIRFSYFFSSTGEAAPNEQDCPGCLGIGAPAINIPQSNLFIGSSGSDSNLGRRFGLSDTVAWQHSTHRVRFGTEWEYNRGGILTWANEPATLTLWSPTQARQYDLPLPSAFATLNDILQLPLESVTVAIGDPRVPQQGGGYVRHWPTARLFIQDSWRVRSGFTVNYGLGWSIDQDLNYDLSKPALFAPLLGNDGLGPPRKSWKNFSPVLGLAWAPASLHKTVIRAGAGLYYEPLSSAGLDAERATLGPPSLGLQTFSGSSLQNTLPGIPGVPVGASLDFHNVPTLFTGADLLAILPAVRSSLTANLAGADPSVQSIQLTKQVSGTGVFPADYKTSSALHTSVGVQREIARDLVVSADLVYRHFVHLTLGSVDLNHFNSILGPVIPKCTGAQRNDPQAICSLGVIDIQEWQGRATYKGVLLRVEKRFSHGFQVLGSYAYSSNTGTNNGNGFNLYNWLQNTGPLPNDYTNILNLATVTQLPGRFELGINFSYSSARPFSAYVGGIDLNGDGTQGDLLPGTTVDALNRGMGSTDLERLVAQFNSTYAGAKDAAGRSIPQLVLPSQYSFGDSLQSLDLRLSRVFDFRERGRLSLIGEVFNLYNAANLTGYSGDLTSAGFGQPTSRTTQVFGSGGPRAFQLAAKLSF